VAECRICRNADGNETLAAREMMLGTRDAFDYSVCAACGCVQIARVPDDLERYYPDDYYAHTPARPEGRAGALLKRLRADHLLARPNPVGWLVTRLRGVPVSIEWVRRAGVGREHDILDVGCGAGALLLGMAAYGFRSLTGIDPFIARDLDYGNGVRVWKRGLDAHDGRYDLVMLHHTFEHMDAPGAALKHIRRLLAPGGTALLRMPVASSEAFARYRADWVQLDAPRHLYLHTPRSLSILAGAAGLDVADVVYDSTAFQFWGSEQYRRDIPLFDAQSYMVDRRASPFTGAEIEAFAARARQLNAEGRGDQAAFYLRARD